MSTTGHGPESSEAACHLACNAAKCSPRVRREMLEVSDGIESVHAACPTAQYHTVRRHSMASAGALGSPGIGISGAHRVLQLPVSNGGERHYWSGASDMLQNGVGRDWGSDIGLHDKRQGCDDKAS